MKFHENNVTSLKVDFKGRQSTTMKKQLIKIIPLAIIFQIIFHTLNDDQGLRFLQLILYPISILVIVFSIKLCVKSLNIGITYKAPYFLFLGIFLLSFYGVLATSVVLSWKLEQGDVSNAVLKFNLSVIVIMLGFAVIGSLVRRKYASLLIYPRVIASAERSTDEYLDGYSERPVVTEFPSILQDEMGTFHDYICFLFTYVLVWDVEYDDDNVKLLFPPSYRNSFFPPKTFSYIKIHYEGNAEVFITPEDYHYLNIPISYHLLCSEVAKNMERSYEYFSEGRKRDARDVFALKDAVIRNSWHHDV